MGEPKQGSDAHIRAIVWVRGEAFKAESEVADLGQPKWDETQSCDSHTHPGQRCGSPGSGSGWELQQGDCAAIPGRGLLLTAERQTEGDRREETVVGNAVEESQAAMEASDTAESCIGGGAINTASKTQSSQINK